MKNIIIPAQINNEPIKEYIDQVREKLDEIEDNLEMHKDSPGRQLASFLHNVSEVRDLSAISVKHWAIQWYNSGAKVATIARSCRMSWSGVQRWISEEEEQDQQ